MLLLTRRFILWRGRWPAILAVALTIAVATACSGSPAPTPTPLVVVATTVAPLVETPTAAPTPTAEPTPVVLPTPVIVQDPTAAPTAAPAEPTPEPTVAPLLLLTQADFLPQNRNPLTGELVDDPAVLQRRPILCKISNSPPEWVRPQSGLNAADIIFEHYAEGAITRFSAIFYGRAPASIGPVRSARLIDLELPLMYDAALCFSGGSSGQGPNRGVYQLVFDTTFRSRILRTDWPGYYRTGENKPYEHTFYLRPAEAWGKLAEIGQNSAPEYVAQAAFGSATPLNSAPASVIAIDYGPGMDVEWRYDAELGRYRRWTGGQPTVDALDGEQVAFSNVVIVKAPHYVNRNICEFQGETQCLAFSVEIQLWGKGFASVFRDGRQIDGEWRRENRAANGMMLTFHDAAGAPIPLQIGNTWIQVAPYSEYLDTPITVQP